jgi:glyoxylase-like metal-dependent hydrolase (beta-lactamase superfamily II)
MLATAMRHTSLLCLLLGASLGCGSGAEKPPIALTVFDCGEILVKNLGELISPGIDVGVSRSFFVPCYLIEHPEGRLIWDAGLTDALAKFGDAGHTSGDGGFVSTVKRTLAAQLEEIGVDPADVEYVAFSHVHFDHTGNGNLFTNARWLVQQADFEAAFAEDAREHFYDPDTYDELKDRAVLLNGDHDLFGDGSVLLLSTPGHTPGHQVLALELRNRGRLLLSGDLWHTSKNRAGRVVPAFNFDAVQTLASMQRVEAYLAETGAALWIEHERDTYPDVPLAPASID